MNSKKSPFIIILIGILLLGIGYARAMSRAQARQVSTVFIGDSYELTSQWAEHTAEKAGMRNYRLAAYGGTGFAASVEAEGQMLNFEQLLVNSGSDNLVDTIRWIIVEGGTNDQNASEEEILGGMESFIAKAKEIYPYAQVIIGMNGWNTQDPDARNMLNTVTALYRSGAEKYGAWYMEGCEEVLKNTDQAFLEDGFHPNENGGKALGEFTGTYLNIVQSEQNSSAMKEQVIGIGVNILELLVIFGISYAVIAYKKKPKVRLIEK